MTRCRGCMSGTGQRGLRAAVPHQSSNQATAANVAGKKKSSREDNVPGG